NSKSIRSMKCFLIKIFTSIFLITSFSYSQVNTQWKSFYNGSANDTDVVTSFKVDNTGNVYVTGFSIGSGTGRDFATIKYNSNGQQLWAERYNNPAFNGNDAAAAIEIDNVGNVYVTGRSQGNETFEDYLTVKYSSEGDQLWVARYNGKGNDDDIAYAIVLDGLGNVYVTGSSVGKSTSEDYVTIKYSPAGDEQWASSYDSDFGDVDIATSISLDNSGNIIVTGFSIGDGTSEDYATVKYNSLGEELWVTRYNGSSSSYDIASALAVDAAGNVYVTGFSYDSLSSEDYATIKYNSSGEEQWISKYNGSSNEFDISTAIDVDGAGNVYVTGYSFDSNSSEDYATIKYNSSGFQLWVSKYNGSGNDYDIAMALKTDNNGNVYVTGYSYASVNSEDYATIKYNSSGEEQWSEIFEDKTNGSDIANSIEVDGLGNVYVTGYSYEGSSRDDYVTIKYSQTVGISQNSNTIPVNFILNQNYPNPFNPKTIINYELPFSNFVSIKVYDILGNEVIALVNERQNAGIYSVDWNAVGYPSGVYFYKLETERFADVKRMLLIK
ncbi:MAG: SBBP repeat-containing protein, partial [Ignavibacteria bacterium]